MASSSLHHIHHEPDSAEEATTTSPSPPGKDQCSIQRCGPSLPPSPTSSSAGSGRSAEVAVASSWFRMHDIRSTWSGDAVVPDAFKLHLTPAWRMFVLGDGSPTRNLHMLTGSPTTVDVLDMTEIGDSMDDAPPAVCRVAAPRLRRQVWLQNERGERLGYATSWWDSKEAAAQLADRKLPIWKSLASLRTEIYREILEISLGSCEALEKAFDTHGPFWGRSYLFWHDGKPMCFIYEVFSPLLERYLGPMSIGESPPNVTVKSL